MTILIGIITCVLNGCPVGRVWQNVAKELRKGRAIALKKMLVVSLLTLNAVVSLMIWGLVNCLVRLVLNVFLCVRVTFAVMWRLSLCAPW